MLLSFSLSLFLSSSLCSILSISFVLSLVSRQARARRGRPGHKTDTKKNTPRQARTQARQARAWRGKPGLKTDTKKNTAGPRTGAAGLGTALQAADAGTRLSGIAVVRWVGPRKDVRTWTGAVVAKRECEVVDATLQRCVFQFMGPRPRVA